MQNLVQDLIDNKRFNYVSEVINEAVKDHVDSIRNLITQTPKVLNRIYDEKELIIDENDSQEIKKIKQRLKRKQSEEIRFNKSSFKLF